MSLFNVIQEDHQKLLFMFQVLEETSTESMTARVKLLDELRHHLLAHMRSEIQSLHVPLEPQTNEATARLQQAHKMRLEIGELLESLVATDPGHSAWATKLAGLHQRFREHIAQVEQEVVPLAQQQLSAQQAEDLGEQMRKMDHKIKMDVESDGFPTLQDAVLPELSSPEHSSA